MYAAAERKAADKNIRAADTKPQNKVGRKAVMACGQPWSFHHGKRWASQAQPKLPFNGASPHAERIKDSHARGDSTLPDASYRIVDKSSTDQHRTGSPIPVGACREKYCQRGNSATACLSEASLAAAAMAIFFTGILAPSGERGSERGMRYPPSPPIPSRRCACFAQSARKAADEKHPRSGYPRQEQGWPQTHHGLRPTFSR